MATLADDATLAAQLTHVMSDLRHANALQTPPTLEAARDLQLRQDDVLRALQREVADLERHRDHLRRENNELVRGTPSRSSRGRGSARTSLGGAEDAEVQQIIEYLLKESQRSFAQALAAPAAPSERDPLQPSVSERDVPDDMQAQVQSMATIAGLEFLGASTTPVELAAGDWGRAHELTGQTYGLYFKASFRASDATFRIENLAIAVSPEARSELDDFIATCEREAGLLVFFKGLVRYARLRAHRLRLYERLLSHFPSLVTFPHTAPFATTVLFRHAAHDEGHALSVQLVLLYELRVTPDGRVEPRLALLPRVPKAAAPSRRAVHALDRASLLDQLPGRFQALVAVVGVAQATEMLVRTVLSAA